ncbi:MAG: PQQ-binding-like beta-propeller repeat protein [Thermodesulfobacteriota bacterium]|nr:PQQ-binding-like beta-propeller repeat protein [Thermodesulfobacteriota bacterium]
MRKGTNKISRVLLLPAPLLCFSILWGGHVWSKEVTQKWDYGTGGEVASSPAIGADGTIYVGSADGCLYAIGSDGAKKWTFKTGGSVISSPAVASDGSIYVGSGDGRLYAINHDGTFKWAYQTGDAVYSSPVIGRDGTIYVGSWDHHVYALSPDGLLRWTFETGNGIFSSPAIGPDNTIYVGSSDGKLYALKGGERLQVEGTDDATTATGDAFKEIRDIRFEAEEDGEERVVFLLNSVFSPKVLTLDGDKPRVICDFAGAHLAGNISREIAVVGARIQYIRTSLGPDDEGVKVVLEVDPEESGMLKGPFFDEEHVFSGNDGYLYMFILKPDVHKHTEADSAG